MVCCRYTYTHGGNYLCLFQNESTSLLWACSRGLSEVALLLIDKGARVNGVSLSSKCQM